MEQWILDGRSLIRQRDPAKARPSDMVLQTLQEQQQQRSPNAPPVVATSKLLGSAWSRVSPRDASMIEYCFLTAVGSGGASEQCWSAGFDYSGVHGFVRKGAAPAEQEVESEKTEVEGAAKPKARGLPQPYSEVVCDLRWYFDGKLADEALQFEFVAGAGVVPQAAEEGALHTRVGQTSTFLVDPAFAFREDGLPARGGRVGVPGDGVVTLELTLHAFRNPLTEAEKVEEAEQCKASGNEAMAVKDFKAASAAYRRGLTRLASGASGRASKETMEAQRKLKATLLHNLAAAIMAEDPLSATAAEQAAGHCTRALGVDPEYAKARFRRALAYVQARKFDLADADARHLAERKEGDPAAVEHLVATIAAARAGRV